jgi:uncharacterized membrane protein
MGFLAVAIAFLYIIYWLALNAILFFYTETSHSLSWNILTEITICWFSNGGANPYLLFCLISNFDNWVLTFFFGIITDYNTALPIRIIIQRRSF